MKKVNVGAAVLRYDRNARVAPLGGFNLLPWRRRAIRHARRRCVIECFAAVLAGGVCAAFFIGWQSWERSRLDAAAQALVRPLSALGAPLAEHRRLAAALKERHARDEASLRRAVPLDRLLGVLDMPDPGPGVMLQQLTLHAGETGLQAQLASEPDVARWLAQLRGIRGVQTINVVELRRSKVTHDSGASVPLQMSARLVWEGDAASASQSRRGARP